MGQGELSLLVMLWVLRDLRPNSILILEEPETHVSPRAQAALMNVIARACDEKGIWVIVTTHSPTITSRIPLEHLRLLVRDGQGISIIENSRRHQLAAILGGPTGFKGALIVEDDAAAEMTMALLEELSPDFLRQFEIVPAGSAAGVSAALKFPRTRDWLRVVGVYDGDQRENAPAAVTWPFLYLPGKDGPESVLRAVLNSPESVNSLVSQVRRDRNDVVMTLEAKAGLDSHDWVIECARQLNMRKGEFIHALTRVWLEVAANREEARQFVRTLEAKYDA
jgi:hypothetical protein